MPTPTPGPVFRAPGIGLNQGAANFVQAFNLAKRTKLMQEQTKQQETQLEMQQAAADFRERQANLDTAFELIKGFGPEIIEDEAVQGFFEENGIDPKAIKRRFDQAEKDRTDELNIRRDLTLRSVPKGMEKGVDVFFKALNSGAGQEAATALMREAFARSEAEMDPEVKAKLAVDFPHLFGPEAGIPFADAVSELVTIRSLQAQLKTGVGQEVSRQLNNELARLKLRMDELKLAEVINNKGLTPSQKLQAALALERIVSGTIEDPLISVSMINRFPNWMSMSPQQKITALYGGQVAKAVRELPGLLAEIQGQASTEIIP